jgi:hypothetical protein
MGHQHQTKPIVSGAKMTIFLLGATLASLITFGMFTRSAQAEILNPVTQTPSTIASCLLNIGVCPPPITDPNPTPVTNPVSNDPNPTPPTDPTPPKATVSAAPTLAGGASQVVTITGNVSDDKLSSYVLKVNGTVLQQASSLTEKSVDISATWNVSTPNIVPSGIYTITLDATDKEGITATATTIVTIDNDGPNVTVTGGDTIIKSGPISPTTVADDPHGVAFYAWTAAPSNPGVIKFNTMVAEPTFTPTVEGTYSFTLIVTDTLGNFTPKTFSFSYAKELAKVPLPTTQNPTDALVDQSPSTPTIAPASIQSPSQSRQDTIVTADNSGVLGSTSTTPVLAPPTGTVASIAPTDSGWSIFGILWYWWLVIISVLYVAWLMVKKFVAKRTPQSS